MTPIVALADGPPVGPVWIRDAVVAVVVIWGAVVWWVCRRESRLPPWLVLVDAALFSGIALNAATLEPAAVVGEGSSWVSASQSSSVLLASWSLRLPLAILVTLAAAAAYALGALLSESGLDVSTGAVLPMQLVLGLVVVRFMRRTAVAADQAWLMLEQAERQRAIFGARTKDAERQRLTLHDTVLATLIAVSRGSHADRSALVRRRATLDLARLETQPRQDLIQPTGSATLASELRQDAELRGISLAIQRGVEFSLPTNVADAVRASISEGLSNIERHAGVEVADLHMHVNDGKVTITLSDLGSGFAEPRATRSRGIRHSINRRMTAVGGEAHIVSSPGVGTAVVLSWQPGQLDFGDEPPERLRSLLTDAYATGLARGLSFVALLWHVFTLSQLLSELDNYRSPEVAVGAWLVLAAVAIWLVLQRPGRPVAGTAGWTALAAAVGASASLVAMCQGTGLVGWANWAIGGFGWFLVALTTHLPLPRVIAVAPVVPLVNVIAVLATFAEPAGALGHLVSIFIFVGYLQFGALLMYRILRRHGAVAEDALRTVHRIETERAAQEAVNADRAVRYRNLEASMLPFMRGLSTGDIDVADPARQNEAWVRASVLRTLIEHDTGNVSAKTIDCVVMIAMAAAERGLAAEVRLDDLGDLPPDVADALVSVLQGAIASAMPGDGKFVLRTNTISATATACLPTSVDPCELRAMATTAANGVPVRVDAIDLDGYIIWLEAGWTR